MLCKAFEHGHQKLSVLEETVVGMGDHDQSEQKASFVAICVLIVLTPQNLVDVRGSTAVAAFERVKEVTDIEVVGEASAKRGVELQNLV